MINSLKFKFLFLVAILIGCAVSITTIASHLSAKDAINQAITQQLSQLAINTGNNISSWIGDRKQDLSSWSNETLYQTSLADTYLGRASRNSAVSRFKEKQSNYLYYESLNIANTSGEIIISSDETVIGNISVHDHLFFQEAMSGVIFLSTVIKSPASQKDVFVIAVPVKQDTVVTGVFYGIIDIDSFNDLFINPIKIGTSGYVFLIDADGITIAHPINENIARLNVQKFDWGKEILSKKEGFISYKWKGTEKTSFFKLQEKTGWRVIAGENTDEIFSPVHKLHFKNLMIAMFFILVAILSLTYLYRRIIQTPMNSLIDGIVRLGKGELDKSIELTSKDEFSHLAKAFNKMASDLKKTTVSRDELAVEIRERKKADDSLQESEKRIRALISNIRGAVYRFQGNPERTAEFVSDYIQEISGYPASDFFKNQIRAYSDIIFFEDKEMVEHVFSECIKKEEPYTLEYRIVDANDNLKWVFERGRCVYEEGGSSVYLDGIIIDITERKRGDEERIWLEQELSQAQKLESIGTLAAGVAHEMNTPIQYIGDNTSFIKDAMSDVLHVLHLYSDLFEDQHTQKDIESFIIKGKKISSDNDITFFEEEIPSALDQTIEGVNRVAEIVKALKSFSHIGSENKSEEDITNAIENTLIVSRNEWKYVAEIEKTFDEFLPLVSCYIGEIKQVILNLIVNGAHAIEKSLSDRGEKLGKITIKTFQKENNVIIAISDTGSGIPESIREKIFDPFFTTKEVGKGTGQGLSISYRIIAEKHNGKIWFESEPEKGTTFYIELPVS